MKNNKNYSFEWESDEEKLRRSIHLPPYEKLRALREMNEFFNKVLSDKQKALRRKLRETRQ